MMNIKFWWALTHSKIDTIMANIVLISQNLFQNLIKNSVQKNIKNKYNE